MTKLISDLNNLINTTSLLIMFFISLFLLILELFISGYTMIYVQEIRYIFGISFIPFLFALFLFINRTKITTFVNQNKRIFTILFYCYLTILCVYLCLNCTPPNYDAQICLNLAKNFQNLFNASLSELYYIMQYPFNISIILFDYIMISISSEYFMAILYGLNIFCLLLSYYYLEKIFILIYNNKFNDVYFKLISLLWIPPLFMTPFIYGWLYGIFLIILAIYNLVKYNSSSKLSNLLTYFIFLTLGIFFKLNYAIYGIAIVLGLLFSQAIKKNKIKFGLIILTLTSVIIGLKAPTTINQILFNIPKNSSSPISLHVMMTNYREDNLYIPGWVDGTHEKAYYNATLPGFENASIRANELAVNQIKIQLQNAINNPKNAAKFYIEKLASGWATKDFGIFNEFECSPRNLTIDNSLAIYILLFSIQTGTYLIFYGFFRFCINLLKIKNLDIIGWIFGIGFVGFFLYHLISEIQSRYVIIPILMIIPLASLELNEEINPKKIKNNKIITTLLIISILDTSFNTRYYAINNNHKLKELVAYDILTAHTIAFTLTQDTKLEALNIMLAGTGVDDALEIVIYDESGCVVHYENKANINVDAYWWNLIDIKDVFLKAGSYSISLKSKSNNIKLLVDYNNNSYFELLSKGKRFTSIKDLRYITPNNILK